MGHVACRFGEAAIMDDRTNTKSQAMDGRSGGRDAGWDTWHVGSAKPRSRMIAPAGKRNAMRAGLAAHRGGHRRGAR
jgi:hypothetical protein